MGNCEVITQVDTGSDHRMIRARVDIKKKLMRLKKIQKQNHSNQSLKSHSIDSRI